MLISSPTGHLLPNSWPEILIRQRPELFSAPYKATLFLRGTLQKNLKKAQTPFRGILHLFFSLFALEIQCEVHCYQISPWPRIKSVGVLYSLHMTSSTGQITRPLDISFSSAFELDYGQVCSTFSVLGHPAARSPKWHIFAVPNGA